MPRGFIVGFILISICAVIHTTGILIIGEQLVGNRRILEQRSRIFGFSFCLSLIVFVITLLHLAEIVVWALAYWLSGLVQDFESAFYFSLGNYTTNAYGAVSLPEQWRVLGGLESITGMLLCGLSTAFLFTLVRELFDVRSRKRTARQPTKSLN